MSADFDMSPDKIVIQDTVYWLERAVIGLNLCPFAKSVHTKGQIHYAVSRAQTSQQLLIDLTLELEALVSLDAKVRDTALLIVPDFLSDFLEFNQFLVKANQALAKLGLDGVIQIASLHPRYQFAGTDEDDITNFTNRSPYPSLHLLREASIDRAVQAFAQAQTIYERNMQIMTKLGLSGWAALGVGRTSSGATDNDDS